MRLPSDFPIIVVENIRLTRLLTVTCHIDDTLHQTSYLTERKLMVHSAEVIHSNVAMFLPQIGTHIRAKRKREELSNVLAAMRKAAAKKD